MEQQQPNPKDIINEWGVISLMVLAAHGWFWQEAMLGWALLASAIIVLTGSQAIAVCWQRRNWGSVPLMLGFELCYLIVFAVLNWAEQLRNLFGLV